MSSIMSDRMNTSVASFRDNAKSADPIERWHEFFHTNKPSMSDQKKCLHWMSRFTQLSLVSYLRLRKVYPQEVFTKQRYDKFTFFTFNKKHEHGKKAIETTRSIVNFINQEALRALRFQLFHSAERPDEIGEELHFQFYYGRNQRVELNFGDGKIIALDMTDCSYEKFLYSFGEMLGQISAYCSYLTPLPDNCEKRFRTSFYKKVPRETLGEDFSIASPNNYYAPNIKLNEIGKIGLRDGGAVGTVLRTCYLTDELHDIVKENMADLIQKQINQIFGQAGSETLVETPRQAQNDADYLNQDEGTGSELPPQLDHAESSIANLPLVEEAHQLAVSPSTPRTGIEEAHQLAVGPSTPRTGIDVQEEIVFPPTPQATHAILQSPVAGDTGSVVSLEVVFSPYLRQPLIHETTHIIDNPASSPSDDGRSDSESGKRDGNDEASENSAKPKKATKQVQGVRRSTRINKAKTVVYAEQESSESSSEEDPHKNRRKKAPVKRKPNRSQIMEASKQTQSAKRPRRILK